MKIQILWVISALLFSNVSLAEQAYELTAESLYGKWLFTHILMDGDREMPVNRPIEFFEDGTVVNYDMQGNEKTRGTFRIEQDTILYEDDNGPQAWKLVSLDEHVLHVDHMGAEMFFNRQ
jgi:hypothetical protein